MDVIEANGAQQMYSADDLAAATGPSGGMRLCERCLEGKGEIVLDENDAKIVPEGRTMPYKAIGKSRGLNRLCNDCYTIYTFDQRTDAAKESIRLKQASYEEKQRILKEREDRKQRNLKHKNSLVRAAQKALQNGTFDEAISKCTCAFEYAPRSSSLFIMRSVAFLQAENFSGALEDAQAAFEANPKLVRSLTLKAEICELQGNYQGKLKI